MQAQGAASVLEIERRRAAAIVEADLETLERLTAADYSHVDVSGRLRSRADFLHALDPALGRYTAYDLGGNSVRIEGTIAIVTGRFVNRYLPSQGAERAIAGRHVRLYRRSSEGWENIYHQGTVISN